MKKFKYLLAAAAMSLIFISPLAACESNPVDQGFDAVEDMAEEKDNTQNALDDFHQNADDKDAEAQEILDMVE